MCASHNMCIDTIDKYLSDRNWEKRCCPQCKETYYTKKCIKNCGSYTCNQGITFINQGSPRYTIELIWLINQMNHYFCEHGYENSLPIDIVRNDERTLFASAAGQVFDKSIYEGHPPNNNNVFIVQPVVRLQKIDLVGAVGGVATSFVNVATESWHASPEDHVTALDAWLDFFSANMFYAGNLCLKRSQKIENWNGITVYAHSLKINYYGLEIAIANFFDSIPQQDGETAMSDISLGAERLVWAINKSESYFDAIGPVYDALRQRDVVMDTIRTLTLMASAGVVPGHKKHGYRLRLVSRHATSAMRDIAVQELIDYYYDQWMVFINPKIQKCTVENILLSEVDKCRNNEINNQFGTNIRCNQTREKFLRELVHARGISLSEIRNQMKGS